METCLISSFAPASVANVAIGFDMLGFSIADLGDIISATKVDSGIKITSIEGNETIPLEIKNNTAGVALLKFMEYEQLDFGIEMQIKKGIPLGSGLGGSAASAVAAVCAGNALLKNPLKKEKLFKYALYGEQVASGSMHGDNVAASLFGGLTACINPNDEIDDFDIINLPIPDWDIMLIHPELVINTRDARSIILKDVPLQSHVKNSMRLTKFISALYEGKEISGIIKDTIIEPQRAKLIPGFDRIKKLAEQAGLHAFSISGAGPSMFAISPREELQDFKESLETLSLPWKYQVWISRIDTKGAHIL